MNEDWGPPPHNPKDLAVLLLVMVMTALAFIALIHWHMFGGYA